MVTDFIQIKSKKRKKTLAININERGEVIVKTPLRTSYSEAKEFIEKNQTWIQKRKQEVEKLKPKKYLTGEQQLIFGKQYVLKITQEPISKAKVIVKEGYVNVIIGKKHTVEKTLNKFYRLILKNKTTELSTNYANQIGEKYNKITIKKVSTRWGSCSTKRNLNYNINLAKAPVEIIDYVCAHEVCHLKHPHHKKGFWDEVKNLVPNYKEKVKWLKQNGQNLY